MGERLPKVLGQIVLGTLDSGERSLPFGLIVHSDLSQGTYQTKKHNHFKEIRD